MAKKKPAKKAVVVPKGALYYAEYLQHYMGDSYTQGHVTPEDLKKVAIVMTREEKELSIPEDKDSDELLEEVLNADGATYMATGIFGYDCKNYDARLKKILAAVSKNGVFGSTEEEGSWAIGKTAAKARAKVDALEAKVKKDCGGDW